MVLRKGFVFILSSILTSILLTILSMSEGSYTFFEAIGFIFIFSSPIILILGMPISILSELLLKNNKGKGRFGLAFGIHLFFGLAFGIVLSYIAKANMYFIASTLASIIVWSTDECLKITSIKKT